MTLPVHTAEATPTPLRPGPTPARAHLLSDDTVEQYRRAVAAGTDRVARRIAEATGPFTGVRPDELAPQVEAIDLDRPLGDTTAALDELEDVYLRDAVWFHHPRYLAHLNCPVVIPALLGEAVLSAVNSSMDTWDQSAGGTLIERRLVEWTADRIGLGPAADGVFTSGGTQSNLHALLLAREEALAAATPADRRSCCPSCGSSPRRPVISACRRRPSCSAWHRTRSWWWRPARTGGCVRARSGTRSPVAGGPA